MRFSLVSAAGYVNVPPSIVFFRILPGSSGLAGWSPVSARVFGFGLIVLSGLPNCHDMLGLLVWLSLIGLALWAV